VIRPPTPPKVATLSVNELEYKLTCAPAALFHLSAANTYFDPLTVPAELYQTLPVFWNERAFKLYTGANKDLVELKTMLPEFTILWKASRKEILRERRPLFSVM
jgi:hypothetical protein